MAEQVNDQEVAKTRAAFRMSRVAKGFNFVPRVFETIERTRPDAKIRAFSHKDLRIISQKESERLIGGTDLLETMPLSAVIKECLARGPRTRGKTQDVKIVDVYDEPGKNRSKLCVRVEDASGLLQAERDSMLGTICRLAGIDKVPEDMLAYSTDITIASEGGTTGSEAVHEMAEIMKPVAVGASLRLGIVTPNRWE